MTTRTRREFLGEVGGLALAAAGALPGRDLEAADRPNIVLILADDLGYNDLSCYGQQRFRTPNIDRLAAEGARLTAHYSGSPVCAPSRCSLLTGLHTGHACIRDNDEMPELGDVWNNPSIEGQRPIPSGTSTIASVLKTAGYRTALVGKWGLGGPGSEGEPSKVGFDESFGYLCQRQAHNAYPDHLWHNGRRVPLDNPTFSAHQKFPAGKDPLDPRSYDRYRGRQYALDLMLDRAVDFIRANRSQPFFLHLTPTIPHVALQVPEDSLAEYLGKFPETPYLGDRSYLPHFAPRAAYAAMISRLDRGVGRLLDTLVQTGLDRRTLVIFTSDNGATFEVGGYDPAFFRSNAPWRGAKQDLYEGGIRVPFVARWPARIPTGLVRHDPTASWDLMATFAQLPGTGVPGATRLSAQSDGTSIWPALTGGRQVRRDHLYWEFQGRQALRQENWKLFRNARKDVTELYDLQADPGETTNLAAREPGRVARMARVMAAARTESQRYPLLGKPAPPPLPR
jgi:arylsulfatase A-like enzyme